jgi:hypothetical protein
MAMGAGTTVTVIRSVRNYNLESPPGRNRFLWLLP